MILSVFLLSTNAFSKIHEFETTHLKSTGGTGVAGIFNEESAFLNPASLAFFNTSSAYAQKDSGKLINDGVFQPRPKALGFVLSDANPSLSGSLSYVNQEEDIYKRKRWGLTFSSPLAEKSAFGISVRQSIDENSLTKTSIKYYQTVLGVTHAIDEKLSVGIVAYDPFKSKGSETKAMVGFQYVLMSYITGSFDFGGDYYSDSISKTLLYKGSIQIKVLDDFFLRFGGFNDKSRSEKGSGYGLAWNQPRLSFEFALKNTNREKNLAINQSESSFKETSFSGSLKF
ncbi:MAG: hypothetical protein Q7U04_09600 [Bacteriovorax sp.]|nr:hypothetical protein [Bacteriovorax sp.]